MLNITPTKIMFVYGVSKVHNRVIGNSTMIRKGVERWFIDIIVLLLHYHQIMGTKAALLQGIVLLSQVGLGINVGNYSPLIAK
jgi:hypothetical protein